MNKKDIQSFVYTPVGFVAEHLEVLYDNDYECKVVWDEIGANYSVQKCQMINLNLLMPWQMLY